MLQHWLWHPCCRISPLSDATTPSSIYLLAFSSFFFSTMSLQDETGIKVIIPELALDIPHQN